MSCFLRIFRSVTDVTVSQQLGIKLHAFVKYEMYFVLQAMLKLMQQILLKKGQCCCKIFTIFGIAVFHYPCHGITRYLMSNIHELF